MNGDARGPLLSVRAKLGLLGALYLSQGLPFGFFTQALPVLLRELGLSLPAIGLSSLLALPWALKFLWAPLVDRRGTRRAWILRLQVSAALLMVAMALVDPAWVIAALVIGVLLANLLAATQDIATDGLAVSLLSFSERGLGNGVQVAGYRVGMILGGGLLLILFERIGWALTFLAMAAMLLLATIPVALYREPPRERPVEGDARRAGVAGALRDTGCALAAFARQPGMPAWLLVCVTYKAGDALAGGMLRPWLVDYGLGLEDVGWLLGAGAFTTGLVGALGGGLAASRFGRARALVGLGLLQALAVVAHAWAAHDARFAAIAAVTLVEHLTGGMATVALFTCMMDACRESEGATDYTAQASAVVIATGAVSASSGFAAQALGYPALFSAAAILALVGVGIAAWVGPPEEERP